LVSQQDGLRLQTMAQQEPSLQPPLLWLSKQLPLQGQFQSVLAGTLQRMRAMDVHVLSHSPWQHDGSALQTPLQQAESSQPGLPCDAKQSPTPGQDSGAAQTAMAADTHPWSQAVVQHVGSTLHTARLQSRFAHPREACAFRQPSRPMVTTKSGVQMKVASRAQTASQRASQQKGSMSRQTEVQHVESLQPGW
jgi:hypothetical protein